MLILNIRIFDKSFIVPTTSAAHEKIQSHKNESKSSYKTEECRQKLCHGSLIQCLALSFAQIQRTKLLMLLPLLCRLVARNILIVHVGDRSSVIDKLWLLFFFPYVS